jgi:hypothetical protein
MRAKATAGFACVSCLHVDMFQAFLPRSTSRATSQEPGGIRPYQGQRVALEWQSRQDRSKVRATFSGIGQSGVTDRGTGFVAVTMCPASATLASTRAALTNRMGVLRATFPC